MKAPRDHLWALLLGLFILVVAVIALSLTIGLIITAYEHHYFTAGLAVAMLVAYILGWAILSLADNI